MFRGRLQDMSTWNRLAAGTPQSLWETRTAHEGNEAIVPWADIQGTEARKNSRKPKGRFMLSRVHLRKR